MEKKNRLFSTKRYFEDGSTYDYKNGYTPSPDRDSTTGSAVSHEKPQGLTGGEKRMLWSFAAVPLLIGLVGGFTALADSAAAKAEAENNRTASVERVLGELENRYGMESMTHSDNLDRMLVKVDGGLIMNCEATDHEHDGEHTAYVHCNGIADPVAVVNIDAGLNLEK